METIMNKEENDLEKIYDRAIFRAERRGMASGKIIDFKGDSVVVDIGYKSEGLIPLSEFTEEDVSKLKKGDIIDVFVERINDQEGTVTLSREKAYKILAWQYITNSYKNNSVVEGKVIEKTKGGLFVDIKGIKAFMPQSQIDIKHVRNLDNYLGQIIPVKIIKMSGNGFSSGTVIVSRKVLIEEDLNLKRTETLKRLKDGALMKGTVKNITNYGVFVDLGGIDGLLHISDISWRKVNHPSEFFSIGEEKEFLILKYDESTGKVTLGYKQKNPDPWLTVDERYKIGMRVKGKVVNITDYGIFVEIEDGLEGLIHISELDWAVKPKHPSRYASLGDEIEAIITNLDKEERKLSLSLKLLKPKPWDLVAQNYRIGQVISGRVKTITDFGAFIRLKEGVDGLIHISDMSWTKHIKHPSEVLRKGQKIEAVVLNLEPDKERIALGLKQLVPDPWEESIPAKIKLGKEFKGRVTKIADFGIFVEIEDGVEGLVYSSEVDHSKEIKEGDEITARVIKVNFNERKIGLSMRNLQSEKGNED
jgi:small subunit ribosomal protein S1